MALTERPPPALSDIEFFRVGELRALWIKRKRASGLAPISASTEAFVPSGSASIHLDALRENARGHALAIAAA